MPDVVNAKSDKIKSLGIDNEHVEYVAADLSKVAVADALRANPKFNEHLPTLYSVEGLIYYLQ